MDTETSLPLNELIERLYVETHLVTITTEVVTAKLLALEEDKRLQERAKRKALEEEEALLTASVPKHNNNDLEEKSEQLHSEKHRAQAQVQYRRPVETLISVRLKSGELLKTTREVVERLRHKKKSSDKLVESTQSDNVSLMKQLPIGIPFTDRLGNAIRLINSLPNPSNGQSKTPIKKNPKNGLLRSNGRIHKKLKVRAALDKSTAAWASTVRLKPKTSLLQQLDVAAGIIESNSSSITTAFSTDITTTHNQTIHSEVKTPSLMGQGKTLVPLVMKWKSSSNHTKMLPLSTALKRIANDTLHSDSVNGFIKTNGLHTNGVS